MYFFTFHNLKLLVIYKKYLIYLYVKNKKHKII